MGGLRARLQRAIRTSQGDTIVLQCPECGEDFRVGQNSDVEYLAHRWVEETGPEPYYQPTPRTCSSSQSTRTRWRI